MKKILSLLTLLVVAISASAASYIPTTVQTISTNTLVLPKDLAGTETWIKIPSKTLTDKGLNPTEWDDDFGTQPTGNAKCLQVKADGGVYNSNKRVIHMLVTGISGVKAIGQANSGRGFQIGATEYIEGTTTESTAMNVVAGSSEALNPVSCTGLDASKTYIISIFAYSSDTYLYGVYFTAGTVKTVASQAFAGVKQGDATLTENTDYTVAVDGTTITLTNSATMAPEDIKLINHITYTDESTEDKDVDVTLEKNEAGDYFEGTATIGLTTYTVKVPVDDTPTLEADQSALTVTSPKIVTGTATFNLTGANLAGENVTLAFASAVGGLTVSPASIAIAEGAVEQAVTVSYVSTEDVAEAVVNLVVSTEGVSDIVIPVTYSSTAATVYTQENVTEAATWDWSKYGTNEIKLTDDTPLKKTDEFLLASVDNYGYNAPAAAFGNANQLLMTTEYVVRDGKYAQGPSIKFNTTVDGNVTVTYSNTGNRTDEAQRRYLTVNGEKYGDGTMRSDADVTTTVFVEAGEVAISGAFADDSQQYLRFKKIVFTPLQSQDVTVGETGFATIGMPFATTVPAGVTAYAVESVAGSKVTTSAAIAAGTTIPANQGFIITAAPNTYTFTEVAEAEYTGTNILAAVGATAKAATAEAPIFVFAKLSDTKVGFKKATSGSLGAYKAYLPGDVSNQQSLTISFEGEATAVEAIAEADEAEASPAKVIKNGKLYIGNYNVAGQQVK